MNLSILNIQKNPTDLLSLSGKTIVITRPNDQNPVFKEPLEQLGANVVTLPLISILPSEYPNVISETLNKITTYDWVVFTSANGVKFTMQQLFMAGLDTRHFANVKIATIGSQTAEILGKYGLFSDLTPKQFISESMIEAFNEKNENLSEKRFLLLRGNIARDDLPISLEKEGAYVDQISVYRTITNYNKVEFDMLVDRLKHNEIDVITFCSASAVTSFKILIENELFENQGILDRVILASIGPVTSKTLQESFGRVDLETKTHTVEGLVNEIKQYYDNQAQQKTDQNTQGSTVISVINRLETTSGFLSENWCVPRETGRFLHVLALILKAERICEIGTSIGYSTLWLAWAAQKTGGKLDTIEYFEERAKQAKSNLSEAGLLQYVNLHSGKALEVLKKFQSINKVFDLVFIDAAKKEYIDYIRLLEPLMPKGACIVADNTFSHRKTMEDFLTYMENSPMFDLSEIETPNGQLLARKR